MFKLSPNLTLSTQDLTDHTRSRLEYVCAPATATSPSATSTMRRRHQYDTMPVRMNSKLKASVCGIARVSNAYSFQVVSLRGD